MEWGRSGFFMFSFSAALEAKDFGGENDVVKFKGRLVLGRAPPLSASGSSGTVGFALTASLLPPAASSMSGSLCCCCGAVSTVL